MSSIHIPGRAKLFTAIVILLVALVGFAGCSSEGNPAAGRETLMQISTIDALMAGVYDGIMDIGELKKYGDFGLGTFDKLDGEMVMLDGQVYQVKVDGSANKADDSVSTPFAAVTFFEADVQQKLPPDIDMAEFQKYFDGIISTENIFYAIKIEGNFSYVKTRSVPAQEKPYPVLTEITQNQPLFEFNDVRGTVVGFRCPPFVQGINVPGYHLHFLTETRDGGGHILDFRLKDATLYIDETANFSLMLPGPESDFYYLDLSQDRGEELEKVEK